MVDAFRCCVHLIKISLCWKLVPVTCIWCFLGMRISLLGYDKLPRQKEFLLMNSNEITLWHQRVVNWKIMKISPLEKEEDNSIVLVLLQVKEFIERVNHAFRGIIATLQMKLTWALTITLEPNFRWAIKKVSKMITLNLTTFPHSR